MKIHNFPQGSLEWHAVRNQNFTASELDAFALEPISITLTVEKLKDTLDSLGISRKGITKRDELIDLLPDPESLMTLCKGARTAIIKKIVAGQPKDAWQIAMEDKLEKSFEYNIPVQRGNAYEPAARELYEQLTGFSVHQVGFVEHDSKGFGCSPDGLIKGEQGWTHGLEIKCPMPETHIGWLLDGILPADHKLQCHAGMAVTGLDRWDFLSYCPGDKPLMIEVYRDETTERLEGGLKIMVLEKARIKTELKAMMDGLNLGAQP